MTQRKSYEQARREYLAEKKRLGYTDAQMRRKYNPYAVTAYRSDGTRFVARFKNAQEAQKWSKATNTRLGSAKKNQGATTIKRSPRRVSRPRAIWDVFG